MNPSAHHGAGAEAKAPQWVEQLKRIHQRRYPSKAIPYNTITELRNSSSPLSVDFFTSQSQSHMLSVLSALDQAIPTHPPRPQLRVAHQDAQRAPVSSKTLTTWAQTPPQSNAPLKTTSNPRAPAHSPSQTHQPTQQTTREVQLRGRRSLGGRQRRPRVHVAQHSTQRKPTSGDPDTANAAQRNVCLASHRGIIRSVQSSAEKGCLL